MKTMKRFGCLLLVLAMCLALGVTAMAAEGDPGKITINNVDYSDGIFEAYQIFAGDLYVETDSNGVTTKTLSNIEWGAGISTTRWDVTGTTPREISIYDDLAEIVDENGNPVFVDANKQPLNSAAEVAEILGEYGDDSTVAQAFADVVEQFLTSPQGTSSKGAVMEDNIHYSYVIDEIPYGYYLVKNKDDSIDESIYGDAYTDYILIVVDDDAEVDAKESVPPVNKEILGTDESGSTTTSDSSEASIGDEIDFQITSEVPDMRGYNKYYFIAEDTLSLGLTFVPTSVSVKIGELELTRAECVWNENTNSWDVTAPDDGTTTYYYVEYVVNTNGTTSIEIVFHDFLQYNTSNYIGSKVVITYSATLNEDAIIGNGGNANDVKLKYSDNPNYHYGGEDEPLPYEPVGETPEDQTRTYTTGIQLKKVDENGKTLTGAEFTLTGEGVNIVVTSGYVFVENAKGDYYGLFDGNGNLTYTTTAPDPENMTTETLGRYQKDDEGNYIKYSKEYQESIVQKATDSSVTAEVDDNGIVIFEGLGAGEYTITETKTPDGYNTIDPIEVTITWTPPATGSTECTWTISMTDEQGNAITPNSSGVFEIEIVNYSGSKLPGTGGIGTTIFYVVGAVLVCGAVVLLVTKRRTGNKYEANA